MKSPLLVLAGAALAAGCQVSAQVSPSAKTVVAQKARPLIEIARMFRFFRSAV